jgi:hypothetical protein
VVLAAGQVIAGHPWWGVWLSAGLMCAAVAWMLAGWLPHRWAALGSLLYSVRIGAFGYWMDSYWGGAVAAIGGALVVGALPRVRSQWRPRHAAVMAIGIAILANSRPFEGLILVMVAGGWLAWHAWRSSYGVASLARRIVVPIALVLVPSAILTCTYFWKVTGDPFLMPYQVARRTYGIRQAFLGLAPNAEPVYNHKELREEYRWELRENMSSMQKLRAKIENPATFFFGLPLMAPFVMLPWMLGDRRIRFALVAVGAMSAGFLIQQWVRPHYAAPFAGVLFLLLVQALRHLRQVRWRTWRVGVLVFWLVMGAFAIRQQSRANSRFQEPWAVHRANVVRMLEATPDRHLIFVHYDPAILLHRDWLPNGADLEHGKVLWAREMAPERMRALLEHYRPQNRKVWVIDADTPNAPLKPYSEHEGPH